MDKKLRVAIIFGGKSTEHHVSVQSAKSILSAIDKNKYEVRLIGIDASGKWLLNQESALLLNEPLNNPGGFHLAGSDTAIVKGEHNHHIFDIQNNAVINGVDVVFPVLHGTNGEDGSMQGLLKSLNLAFVGSGVLASAICMDKEATRRLLAGSGIATARYFSYEREARPLIDYDQLREALKLPFFVKPASLGSSIGIHKVYCKDDFDFAVSDAFSFDKKILIEENISGREIECAVLGNSHPKCSVPGEVITNTDFYSYESKYIDENGAMLQIPAALTPELTSRLREAAIKVYKLLYCEGMARVDFFLTANGEIILNEVNTIPGFTKNSMYPRLWELSGLPYPQLIDELIALALEGHKADAGIKFDAKSH